MNDKPKVYVTRILPQAAMEMIDQECAMTYNPYERPATRNELEDAIVDIEGLLCLLTDTIDEGLLEQNSRLKIVANYAVGYNNIDVEACTRRNIAVSNTPGVLTDATADLTWALLMAAARRLVEGDYYTRQGKFKAWAPLLFLGQEVYNKTLGIVGMGRIGKAVAKRAAGFNMKVLYYNKTRKSKEEEQELGLEYRTLQELLKKADFVTLHIPLTDETRHLIAAKELKAMKQTAILINTARGPIVDEKALVEALQEKQIAAAALDVYENEPDLELGLTDLSNAILAPHIGNATTETRTRMGVMAASNLIAALKGKPIPNLVNQEIV